MKHYIIVKYNDTVTDKSAVRDSAAELFAGVTKIKGVRGVSLHTSATDFPNRYDLMIIIDMEKEALPRFIDSDIHAQWKRDYTRYMLSKAIFDSDD